MEHDDPIGTSEGNLNYRDDAPRRSSVVLDIVTWDAYQAEALKLVEERFADKAVIGVSFAPFHKAAIVERGETLYVVCDQGVAYMCDGREPFELPVSPEVTDAVIICDLSIKLWPDDLLRCRTGEQINLTNFVRTFGRRIEENFDLLNRTLGQESGL